MSTPVHWLIEKDVFFDGNPEKMAEIVRARGMECRVVRYTEGQPLAGYPDGTTVVVYGSMGFVRDLVQARRWTPTAWFDEQVLACHHYYRPWGRYILQQDYRFLTLGELHERQEELYVRLGTEDRLFIRPDDNLKSFAGGIVERARFEHWFQQNVACYDLRPSLACLVARPQQILGEWRVVIARRQVLTASAYVGETRTGLEAQVPEGVLDLAREIVAGPFEPFPLYVMDIARTPAGLFLMEIGSVNCASLYACDVEKVAMAASRLAEES